MGSSMSIAIAPLTITAEQRRQFHDDGYFLLSAVLSPAQLESLRSVCSDAINDMHAIMVQAGNDVRGIKLRIKRYFIVNLNKKSPPLRRFLFSELMAEVC